MVRSRFNVTVYLIFIVLVVSAIGGLYLISEPQIQTKRGAPSAGSGVACFIFAIGGFLIWIAKIHLLRVGSRRVVIKGFYKNRTIKDEDIVSINLLAKEDFYSGTGSITLITRIILRDASHFIIRNATYSNVGEIKQALIENFGKKVLPYDSPKTTAGTETDLVKFSGNFHTSWHGLFMYFFLLAIFVPIIISDGSFLLKLSFASGFGLLVYITLGLWQFNYFLLSSKRLIIKNQLFFWKNKEYFLDDLIAVYVEPHYKAGKGLRIITSDHNTRLYSASSLRDKTWRKLTGEFNMHGVHVIQ